MTTESQGPHWLTRLVLGVPNVIFAGWLATKMWPWFFPGHITIAQFVGVDMGWSMITGVGLAMRISAIAKATNAESTDGWESVLHGPLASLMIFGVAWLAHVALGWIG
jgi:hypothetical protein